MANGAAYSNMVRGMFEQLDRQGLAQVPPAGSLAKTLRTVIKNKGNQFVLARKDAALFGSAAVEMWLRAIHSFLISASLAKASPIWASVSGYYSSHYCMRAFSHVFGRFLLGRTHQAIEMSLNSGYFCEVGAKTKLMEHQYYWKLPHDEFGRSGDTIFSYNPPIASDDDVSDGFHRVYANYFDHVFTFPEFEVLDETFLRARIDRISELVTDSPTIPDHKKFPDLDSVHVIAYARIVRFRAFMDQTVGYGNRYWRQYRKPTWFTKYMDFQMPEESTLASDSVRSK